MLYLRTLKQKKMSIEKHVNNLDKSKHGIEWAVGTFRPILRDLHIQEVPLNPVIIKAVDYRDMIVKGMSRCIITFQLSKGLSNNVHGYFVFVDRSKQGNDIFLLSIVLNRKIYGGIKLIDKIKRKALAIHEFVHCVSAMLALARIGKNNRTLIQSLSKSIHEKAKATTSDDFKNLYESLQGMNKGIKKGLL